VKLLMPKEMEKKLEGCGIVAVLVIDNPDDAPVLAMTLLASGIRAMELTLRTDSAIESLNRIRREVPEMYAGVGTILTKEQLIMAKESGAAFGVAPGYNRDVVGLALDLDFPFAPGIATPSEIEGAVSQGCRVLKFFHAEGMGGTEYLKGINSPYQHLGLRYIPLGGLSLGNMKSYLALKEILAIGGSWIAPRDLIQKRDWETIAKNGKEASAVLKQVRGGA
jgi:2-dehydro-3-deoxyphosphogluconate aldolase / (4S)-4-hydroxy-2-oxoglutarate aldolase